LAEGLGGESPRGGFVRDRVSDLRRQLKWRLDKTCRTAIVYADDQYGLVNDYAPWLEPTDARRLSGKFHGGVNLQKSAVASDPDFAGRHIVHRYCERHIVAVAGRDGLADLVKWIVLAWLAFY